MRGSLINVPIPGGVGRVPGMLYAPADGVEVVGITIVAPGSNGGTGPGIDRGREGLPLPKSQSSEAKGSIYRRLGCELADAGTIYDWRAHPIDASSTAGRSSFTVAPAVSKMTASSKPAVSHDVAGAKHSEGAIAMLHISWRHTHHGKKWPARKLKLVSSLQTAANDIVAAVNFMRAKYGVHVPVVLVGFSFGGPSVWAAAGKLVSEGSAPAGVVALAGSCRDGAAFEALGLDTLGCAVRCRQAGVSALLLHGMADQNVSIEVPQYFYGNLAACSDAVGALTLAVVPGSEHTFDLSRDTVFSALKPWVIECICGSSEGLRAVAPCGPGAVALQLRGGGRAQPFHLQTVSRDFLLRPEIKGYSEKATARESTSARPLNKRESLLLSKKRAEAALSAARCPLNCVQRARGSAATRSFSARAA